MLDLKVHSSGRRRYFLGRFYLIQIFFLFWHFNIDVVFSWIERKCSLRVEYLRYEIEIIRFTVRTLHNFLSMTVLMEGLTTAVRIFQESSILEANQATQRFSIKKEISMFFVNILFHKNLISLKQKGL